MVKHSWDLSPKQAVALQRKLAGRVREEPLAGPVRYVAGTDCAFLDGGRRIVAAAVLCETRTWQTVATSEVVRPCEFPYVPGLLSFREAPAVIETVRRLPERPGLLMCDGQGRAHPRGLGLACHVGLWLEMPTVGVAKSRLCGEYRTPGSRKGNRARLMLDGEQVGLVLRTRDHVRPLFVSVGHRVTLNDARRWTLRACRGVRLPEPTRRADRYVSAARKRLTAC
jgi:deoxyribonuclease V